MNKSLFFNLTGALVLAGCIQDSDFENFKAKRIDGWSYVSTINARGQIDSASSNEIQSNAQSIGVQMVFQCTEGSNLELLISTFRGLTSEPAPIKMHYAHSALLGKFPVANLKAENHQTQFSLVAHKGAESNILKLHLSPGEVTLKKHLISPLLSLSIPLEESSRDITLKLDNPNIIKVFKDCDFRPSFMMTELSNL